MSLQQLLDIHSGHWERQQTAFWGSAPCYCSPTDQYDGEDGVVLDDIYHRVKHVIRGLLHPQGVFAGVLDKTNLNVVNLLLVVHDQDQRFAVGVDGAVPHQEGPVLVDQVQGVFCVRAVAAPDVPLFLTVPLVWSWSWNMAVLIF